MRILGFLVFLVGLVLSFGSTSLIELYMSPTAKTGTLYKNFKMQRADVGMSSSDSPVNVKLVFQARYQPRLDMSWPYMVLYFRREGKQQFAASKTIYGKDLAVRDSSAVAPIYDVIIPNVEVEGGNYHLTGLVQQYFSPNDFETVSYEIIPNPAWLKMDFSLFGNILIWLGAALFVLGLRRRNRVDSDAPPAPSKWGRGN